MNPYDLSTYAIDEEGIGGIIFNFLSPRNVTLTDLKGWVERAPSADISGSLYLNGSIVSGVTVSISSGGVVSSNFTGLSLSQGDTLRITLNSNADTGTRVRGTSIVFVGTEDDDLDIDQRYDVGFFINGIIPAGRVVAACVVPRNFYISGSRVELEAATNPSVFPQNFLIYKNDSQVGTITISSNGYTFNLINGNENFVTDDVLKIITPGTIGQFIDDDLQDLSITFEGYLGSG